MFPQRSRPLAGASRATSRSIAGNGDTGTGLRRASEVESGERSRLRAARAAERRWLRQLHLADGRPAEHHLGWSGGRVRGQWQWPGADRADRRQRTAGVHRDAHQSGNGWLPVPAVRASGPSGPGLRERGEQPELRVRLPDGRRQWFTGRGCAGNLRG